MPPPQASQINYDELYPKPYVEPRNYIKFSDTVEETLSVLYDMTTEDDEFLKTYNAKKSPSNQLSEDDFERIMEVYEDTAAEQAPFAAVDNTVVPYETMAQAMAHTLPSKLVQAHAKPIYEYWKNRRQDMGNKSLHPSLKFETHQESDDMDPYVCFRRREVRQTRKTRARDVQVADKLKRLRRELEDGRQLVVFSYQRELLKKEFLKSERMVFEARSRVKDTKVRLGIKTDDDDLLNTATRKRQRTEAAQPRVPHPVARTVARPDGRASDGVDLALLSHKKAEKEQELHAEIRNKILAHRRWNQHHIDLTAGPLPPIKQEREPSFRPAKTEQLMTPPGSSVADSLEADEPGKAIQQRRDLSISTLPVYESDSDLDHVEMYKWRRRIGRNNRQWLDRRLVRTGLGSPPREVDPAQSDRWKYDQDSEDEEDPPVHEVDEFSPDQMKYRSTIPYPASFFGRRMEPTALSNGFYPARQGLPQPPPQPHAPVQPPPSKAPPAQVTKAQVPAQAPSQSPPRPIQST